MDFLAMALLALQVSAAVAEGPVVPIGVVAEAMLRLEQFSLQNFPDVKPDIRGLFNGRPVASPIAWI